MTTLKAPSLHGGDSTRAGLMKSVMDTINLGLLVLDQGECVVLWNPWMEKVSGINASEAIGQRLTVLFPKIESGRVHSAVRAALRDNVPSVLSQSLNKAPFPLFAQNPEYGASEPIPQRINIFPLPHDASSAYCLIEIFDISSAVHREKILNEQKNSLKESQAITRALIDATAESALLLDKQGVILAINDIGAQRFQKSIAEMVGRKVFEFTPAALEATLKASAKQLFDTGRPVHFQQAIGAIYYDLNIYPVFDHAGQVSNVAIYAADVSEKQQMQAVDKLFHEIDQQVLSGRQKQNLFEHICSEVARIFFFPLAWIGRKKPNGTVLIKAQGGVAQTYLDELKSQGIRWDNSPQGQEPSGIAIRSGQTQLFKKSDSVSYAWQAAEEHYHLRAQLSVPLILRGEVYGSFTLCSRHENDFDNPAIIQRLADIASRICVALEKARDQQQLRLLSTALATAANGVFISDKHGRIEWLNAAFVKMTGYTEEEALGSRTSLLKSGVHDAAFFEGMWQTIYAGNVWKDEIIQRRKDGSLFTASQTITPIRDAQGEIINFISILEDITARKEVEARIERLAHFDQLTDLPNRSLFHDRLHHALVRAKRENCLLALMFIDLDYFKAINDSLGHDIGDIMLQQVATRLRACVRESDTVARLAGDEFTILLPEIAARGDAAIVAEKVVAAFADVFNLAGIEMNSSTSIGIALYPTDAQDAMNLLKCADVAMYASKNKGRNRYSFYERLDNPVDCY